MTFLFFATSNFKPDTGGIAELGHQLVSALDSSGHDITVIARGSSPEDFDKTVPYRIERSPNNQPGKLADRLIQEKKPDAIFVIVIGSSWLTAKRLGRKYGIPVVLYIHGLEVTKKNNIFPVFIAKQFVKGQLLKHSDIVMCNSFNTMLLAIKRGADPGSVRVLNPGIQSDEYQHGILSGVDPAPGKFVFFTMGRVIRRKGIDQAIRALSSLSKKYPEILYVIAGSGPEDYLLELKELTRSLGLTDKVLFLGRVDEAEKQHWYQRQDVFILPSRELPNGDVEGFGIVFLEAGAWGKPVIGGDSGGIPDAIEDGKSGLLVDSESVEALESAMQFFIDNPDKKIEMGEYGKNRALQKFSWTLQADRFASMIKNHISSPVRKEFNDWKDLPKSDALNREISRENLLIMKEVFDGASIPFTIFFGTLLGAYREHDFIAHDTDTDVILFEAYRDALFEVLPLLEERGLKLVRSVKDNRVLSFYRNGEYIDFYIIQLRRIGFLKKWYIDYSSVSKKLLLNYSRYEFLGQKFRVPGNSHKILNELYGKNWGTPIKDYEANHDYMMKLYRFLGRKDKIGSVRKFIRWIKER